MTFRIKEARERAGYSQKELAELIGVAPNTFHGYESGKHDPKSDLLIKIAKACHVSTDFILGASGVYESTENMVLSESEKKCIQKYRDLDDHGKEIVYTNLEIEYKRCKALKAQPTRAEREPVYFLPRYYSAMSAGTGDPVLDEYPDDVELIKRPPRGASYIAPINGDSMEPEFHDGDQIFVDAQRRPRKGQVGVFYMDGRMWIKELGDGVLISHNPKYDPVPMTEDIQCQGLVLGVCDESYFA